MEGNKSKKENDKQRLKISFVDLTVYIKAKEQSKMTMKDNMKFIRRNIERYHKAVSKCRESKGDNEEVSLGSGVRLRSKSNPMKLIDCQIISRDSLEAIDIISWLDSEHSQSIIEGIYIFGCGLRLI